MDLQYAETLKRLQDCDYAEAISRLTQLQTNLEAAQLSFMRVSGLSLFNYLQ
jgi:flagellar hook-associated protein 3 FlgL